MRVKRHNPSKKKGTLGKQVGGVKLKLREKGSTVVLATTTSKAGTDVAVFDKNVDPNKQYQVDCILANGQVVTEDVGPFGPPEKVGKVFSSTYRTANVEFWVHQFVYRLTLKLGDVDSIFANAANTRAGRMERLQVLGLLPRPLGHAEVDACFDYVWGTYMKRLVSGSDDPTTQNGVGDTQKDAAIKQWLPEYLVEKGNLPAEGQFAKIRVPGDYRSFHRDFDAMYFQEPEFTQYRGIRYNVEKKFRDANPALGKIPVLAFLERKEDNTNNPWEAAPGKKVHLQLAPTDALPGYGGPGGATDLTGATSWTSGVAGAPLRAVAGKAVKQSRKAKNGGAGPKGYMLRHVTERKGDPAFPKPNKNDPQKDNIWAEFGGKRKMAGDMRDVTTAGTDGDNVFRLTELGQFLHKAALQAPAPAADLKADSFAVELTTNAQGEAGVIFAPSMIGGERYKFRGYFGTSKAPRAEAKTGTMVRWRTVRIARSLRVTPPGSKAGLHATIKAEFERYYGECKHIEPRFCGDCMTREGVVEEMDFKGYLTRELSKSYCELIVDKTAIKPAHEVIDKATLDRAIAAVQREQANGDTQGGIVDYVEPATLNAGQVVGTLNGKGTIIPKSVKVIVDLSGNTTIPLIDDGAGAFTGTGKQPVTGTVFEGDGTVDYGTGAYAIRFLQGVPANAVVKITYKLKVALDLTKLFYWADKSPFLLNVHTPQAYNSLIDPTQFPKIPTEFSVTDEAIATGDGTKKEFEHQLPANLARSAVKLDGAALPNSFVVITSPTSKLKICDTEAASHEIAFDTGTTTTGTVSITLPEAPVPSAMMVQLHGVKRGDNKGEEGLAIIRANGNITITGPEKGLTVTWDAGSKRATVNFTLEGADKYKKIRAQYAKPKALAKDKKLTVDYSAIEVYDNTNPKPVPGGLGIPSGSLDKHLAKMINFYVMIKLIRAIDGDNNGYMPGLLGLQSPLRDTWSAMYDPKGLHQGKGLCNGFFVFYGARWRNAPQDDLNTFNQISLHEMSHCLYLNHFPSGSPFGGGSRADLHDMYDNCMMGYGKNDEDLCGKCVAALMGVNTADERLGTWTGESQIANDTAISTEQDEKTDPTKKRHVEPPLLAKPGEVKDADDINSLLLNCPVGKQVWDLAVAANGGVEPSVKPAGATGTGMCQTIPGEVSFPTVARVEFHSEEEKQELLNAGGEHRKNPTGEEFIQFVGDWVGVQILIMELGNLSKRYDFFDLDYRMQKGEVGCEEFVQETERIEYDGGVTYVIRAWNRCKAMWGAPVCQKASAMKKDKSGPLDWQVYYDTLPETHKGKYYGEWHERGMVPFYKRHVARLSHISGDRVTAVMDIVKKTFGSGESWIVPKTPMNLYGDDDACWTLLNLMYTLDADWDTDPNNRVLNWVKTNLGKELATTPALTRVQNLDNLSQVSPP